MAIMVCSSELHDGLDPRCRIISSHKWGAVLELCRDESWWSVSFETDGLRCYASHCYSIRDHLMMAAAVVCEQWISMQPRLR